MAHAYCNRQGVISFGKRIPDGMLPVLRGRDREIRRELGVAARLAYDNKTLLVPGVPEAKDEAEALTALQNFRRWLAKRAATRAARREARA